MTLVVGIRCTDGVVIGTDSAMVFGPQPGQYTIEQEYSGKIQIIENRIIVAGTGEIGLGQRFVDQMRQLRNSGKLKDKNAIEYGRRISETIIEDFSRTSVPTGRYGALVAIAEADSAELVEFSLTNMQPEVKEGDNWYASMGSGQAVADPLLGFVRAAFWGNDPPNTREGIFATTLVLKLACGMSPHSVAEPIRIALLKAEGKGKNPVKASMLSDEELLEHKDSVDGALEHLKQYREKLSGQDLPGEPPQIPE